MTFPDILLFWSPLFGCTSICQCLLLKYIKQLMTFLRLLVEIEHPANNIKLLWFVKRNTPNLHKIFTCQHWTEKALTMRILMDQNSGFSLVVFLTAASERAFVCVLCCLQSTSGTSINCLHYLLNLQNIGLSVRNAKNICQRNGHDCPLGQLGNPGQVSNICGFQFFYYCDCDFMC